MTIAASHVIASSILFNSISAFRAFLCIQVCPFREFIVNIRVLYFPLLVLVTSKIPMVSLFAIEAKRKTLQEQQIN